MSGNNGWSELASRVQAPPAGSSEHRNSHAHKTSNNPRDQRRQPVHRETDAHHDYDDRHAHGLGSEQLPGRPPWPWSEHGVDHWRGRHNSTPHFTGGDNAKNGTEQLGGGVGGHASSGENSEAPQGQRNCRVYVSSRELPRRAEDQPSQEQPYARCMLCLAFEQDLHNFSIHFGSLTGRDGEIVEGVHCPNGILRHAKAIEWVRFEEVLPVSGGH